MLETLKGKLQDKCSEWTDIIRDSDDQSHTIDISTEFAAIFSRNIVHISFGEDISDQLITIWAKTDLEGITPMVEKEVTFV